MSSNFRPNRMVLIALLVSFTLMAVACAGTRGRRSAPETSGFLRDYSQLTEDEETAMRLSYVNHQANWESYDAIWIESISMWVNEETSEVESDDRQMLITFFYKALDEELSKDFRVADGPGPGRSQYGGGGGTH